MKPDTARACILLCEQIAYEEQSQGRPMEAFKYQKRAEELRKHLHSGGIDDG